MQGAFHRVFLFLSDSRISPLFRVKTLASFLVVWAGHVSEAGVESRIHELLPVQAGVIAGAIALDPFCKTHKRHALSMLIARPKKLLWPVFLDDVIEGAKNKACVMIVDGSNRKRRNGNTSRARWYAFSRHLRLILRYGSLPPGFHCSDCPLQLICGQCFRKDLARSEVFDFYREEIKDLVKNG